MDPVALALRVAGGAAPCKQPQSLLNKWLDVEGHGQGRVRRVLGRVVRVTRSRATQRQRILAACPRYIQCRPPRHRCTMCACCTLAQVRAVAVGAAPPHDRRRGRLARRRIPRVQPAARRGRQARRPRPQGVARAQEAPRRRPAAAGSGGDHIREPCTQRSDPSVCAVGAPCPPPEPTLRCACMCARAPVQVTIQKNARRKAAGSAAKARESAAVKIQAARRGQMARRQKPVIQPVAPPVPARPVVLTRADHTPRPPMPARVHRAHCPPPRPERSLHGARVCCTAAAPSNRRVASARRRLLSRPARPHRPQRLARPEPPQHAAPAPAQPAQRPADAGRIPREAAARRRAAHGHALLLGPALGGDGRRSSPAEIDGDGRRQGGRRRRRGRGKSGGSRAARGRLRHPAAAVAAVAAAVAVAAAAARAAHPSPGLPHGGIGGAVRGRRPHAPCLTDPPVPTDPPTACVPCAARHH